MTRSTLLKTAGTLAAAPLVALLCPLADLPAELAVWLTAAAGMLLPGFWLLREREREQQRHEQVQNFVQRLVDVIPEPVYVKDAAGRYIMINEAFALQRGQPRAAILGRSARDLAPDPATAALIAAEDAEVLQGLMVYKEEEVLHPVSHEARFRIVTKGTCLDATGTRVIVGANFDISRIRHAELRLQAALEEQTAVAQRTRDFIQHLIDVIPYPFYIRDSQSRYRWVNSALIERYQLSRDQILGHSHRELMPDRPQSHTSLEEDSRVLAGERIQKEESATRPITGERCHQIVIKGSCPAPEGELAIVGINIDVTVLRESEAQLATVLQREREHHNATLEFVQRVLDLLPYPVYVKDAQSRYLMVNEAMARDAFMPREELIEHMGLKESASPERMRQLFEEDGSVLAGERILREEQLPHPHTGREVFRILSKGTCINALGEPVIVGSSIDLTDLRVAERELKASLQRETALRERTEAFVQRLIDVIPDPVYVKKDGHYLLINDAFADYQNRSKAELLDPDQDFPHLSDASRQRSLEEDLAVLDGAEILREEHTRRRATGEEVYRVVSKRACLYIDGMPVVVGIDRHITKWRQAELQIKEALERETELRRNTFEFVQRLVDLIPDPVYVKKAGGLYVLVNEAFLRYHQRCRAEVVKAPNALPYENEETRKLSLQEDEAVLRGAEIEKEEHTIRQASGEEVFRIISKRRSTYFDGDPVIVGFDNHITRWRIAERELQRLAREDVLTGLANRRHFRDEAERAIARSSRYDEALSLLMLDIDHFKHINDSQGHNIGDEVLKQTVQRCLGGLRSTDLLARWGGEEFIALLPHTRLAEACQVAERLREELALTPITTGNGAIAVTISGGVAQWQAGESLDQLVSHADAALYLAKEGGRNRILPAQAENTGTRV
ncbi:diguanylate cyclase [Uliginosibacterium sp. TH139]|uniref:sensor domain-containing diguanylate cyclase n=1 Tax=Uliginosibacterium sp. TH139 TaxID=2067453 RepID=UPI0013046FDD|nr:diguanylate cyclase [Uliginosibacterium sp. TH139]